MTAPPWFTERASPHAVPPPDRVEVAVIGGGPSGLSAARCLAEGGARVCVLEARADVGRGFAARVPGHVALGNVEHPHRLAAGVGVDDAAALWAFTRQNRDLAVSWLKADETGGLFVAAMPGEEEDVARGTALLESLAVPVHALEAHQVALETGAHHLGPGRRLPDEAWLADPAASCRALAGLAQDAGATVHTDHRVLGVDEGDDLVVRWRGGSLTAEVVVWAAGAACQQLHADFAEIVWPVRLQSVASVPLTSLPDPPARAQHGHLTWARGPLGERVLSGCRWATPHLEVGETDEDTLSPAVDDRLTAMLARLWPGLEPASRWAGIAAFTCDGLPLLGPLPGRPRQVACAGYGGADWSFALRAGQAVAQGLLTGVTGVPDRFSLARFT